MSRISNERTRLDAHRCRAHNVIDQVWRRMSDRFLQRCAEGRTIECFPDLSLEASERMAAEAREALAVIDALDMEALPHQTALTVKLLRFQMGIEAQAADRYWLAQDYDGWPAIFPVGPYGGGYLFDLMLKTFTRFVFARPGDCDRYLALVEDYARFIGQVRQKIEAQAARGIRIPKPALFGMRALVASQAAAARVGLQVDPARLRRITPLSGFSDILSDRISARVTPAFAVLLESLAEDYARRAPQAVGMAQFPDGGRIYEALVTEHLSMPMTVEAVHRAGRERMVELEAAMGQIRGALGYADRDSFHRYLLTDPAWVARSETDVKNRYEAALHRIEPHIDRLFHFRPAAMYRTARLDPKLEGGMTYGYYQKPTAAHPDGVYYFNASRLTERTWAMEPARIFHELIPGHHFHLAGQHENDLLHPLRRSLSFNAFSEGWAEYAATLAGEVGTYAEPCERYGRLLVEAFTTCRLVVDTGMNALGWTLEEARGYLRERIVLSEAEIESETLRYSTDIPAQSLAYKIGEIKFGELRARARSALGERFDLRDFHDVVLGSGGMPLEVLDWHVNSWLDESKAPS